MTEAEKLILASLAKIIEQIQQLTAAIEKLTRELEPPRGGRMRDR